MGVRNVFLLGILAGILISPVTAAEVSTEPGNKVVSGAVESGKIEEKKPLLPFVEVQTAKVSTRYNFVANDQGVTSKNHQQYKEAFNVRFRFDSEGRYSLNTMAESGTGFNSSWDTMGIGSDASFNLCFREFYLSLKPWKQFELQYGGISIARGVSTEITSYDNDAYIMGARVSIKNPKQLFFDEIVGTLAYIGDLNDPNVFHRFDRLDESNYHQLLVSKKIGKRATVSGEYASLSGFATLRQAVQIKIPNLK